MFYDLFATALGVVVILITIACIVYVLCVIFKAMCRGLFGLFMSNL